MYNYVNRKCCLSLNTAFYSMQMMSAVRFSGVLSHHTLLSPPSHQLETRAQVAQVFLSKFQLSSEEMATLRGARDGPVTEVMLLWAPTHLLEIWPDGSFRCSVLDGRLAGLAGSTGSPHLLECSLDSCPCLALEVGMFSLCFWFSRVFWFPVQSKAVRLIGMYASPVVDWNTSAFLPVQPGTDSRLPLRPCPE